MPPPQTVLKVSARAEKSVPLYRGDNEFTILGDSNYTFKTVSPSLSLTIKQVAAPTVSEFAFAEHVVAEL